MIFKFDDSQALQQFNQYNQRKDSQCSEVADLLNPMGRTSRISSVGSQGSAVSRLSGASGISRSPSPHKMLVETSFCGPKPIEPTSDASSIEHLTQDIENVILARRGDPTKVSLAEGVEIKPPTKTTKEKLQEIPVVTTMTPAEAARAAAKEERKREIEALKVRLNAINQRQIEKKKTGGGGDGNLDKSGKVKKVIGVTTEGTEYTRIKLKPDHLYDDKGMSPNEKIIEEKDFQDPFERKREHKKKEEPKKSPATDNRSPSPASASVSRKSSFCNFFKSNKEEGSSKSKPTSAGGGKSGSKLDKSKSPLPSPSKSSFSSRVAFSFFKTNRNASPSQLETPKQQIKPQQSAQQSSSSKDKPKLRYYDAPDVIHIPLHTPPEEKEFSALKKKDEKKEEEKIVPVTVHHHQQQQENQLQQSQEPPKKSLPKRIAPTAQIEKMQSTDEIELHEIPEIPQYRQRGPPPPPPTSKRKVSEDTIVTEGESSLWSIEVQRHSSQESQETVISSQPSKTIENGGIEKSPPIPTYIDTIDENEVMTQQQQQQQQMNQQQRTRHKKHILFSTKIGSGSEEQIFSTQLSLSKTESQSSQLSEQASGSAFESPKNEECGMKMPEVSLKHQSSSEIEKVATATNVRSRSDHSDSGSGTGLQSITRNSRVQQRSSGEFSAKKRESSDELLHKSSPQVQQTPSYESSQHPVVSLKHSDSTTKILQHQSSGGSRMEISSESDRESDIDGCIHKRVSRLMEDHESAGLVLQESFDDELPYVPTTLPEERSTCIKIIPMRERTQTELITIPVERPRSTTPINPTSLDNFCERKPIDVGSDMSLIRGEKLRISLPRHKAEQTKESVQHKAMARRTSNLSNKSWTEFAEQGLQNTSANATPSSSSSKKKSEKSRKQSNSSQDEEPQQQMPPPPATVVKSHSKKSLTSKWIDFENIPEKRQPPKKITTLPMNKDAPSEKIHNSNKHSHHHHHQRQHFNYVSPEECQCECHESKKDSSDGATKRESTSDDSQPLIDDNAERNSTIR